MKKSIAASFWAYAAAHPARATDATIECGRTVAGTVVSPNQTASCTFTTDAGNNVITPTRASSGSLRADAELYDPPASDLLTSEVFGQLASKSTYVHCYRAKRVAHRERQ